MSDSFIANLFQMKALIDEIERDTPKLLVFHSPQQFMEVVRTATPMPKPSAHELGYGRYTGPECIVFPEFATDADKVVTITDADLARAVKSAYNAKLEKETQERKLRLAPVLFAIWVAEQTQGAKG